MAPRGKPKKKVEVVEPIIAVPEQELKGEESSLVKPKDLPTKRGKKDSKIENGHVAKDNDEARNLPAKRGQRAAKIENGIDLAKDKEENEETKNLPAKRGRKVAKLEDDKSVKDNEGNDETKNLPAKRGRKVAKIENGIDLAKDNEENDEAKNLPAKRGRKVAKLEDDESVKDNEGNNEAKNLPAKRGRIVAKTEDDESVKDNEGNDGAKNLPAKRGRKAPKKETDANTVKGKEENDETSDLPEQQEPKAENDVDSAKESNEAKDVPRSKRNAKADVEPPNSVKEQKHGKKTKSKDETFLLPSTKEISVEREVPTKGAGRKRKAVEKPEPKKTIEVGKHRQLQVSLERNKKLDEMAREQKENDAEDFEEPKIKNVKGPTKGKGKRAAKGTAEDPQPTKKTKDDSKSKGAAKKEKDKIPDVTALDFSNASKTSDGKSWNFKIATWNVNGLRAWLEKNGVSYLHHEMPDILCIQETKCSDDKLPPELVNVNGYHCYWLAGDKEGYSGVGLLSKEKPKSVQYGIDMEEHDSEGRVITAEYEEFYVVTTYIPNAGRGLVRLDYRQKWDKDFRGYIKKLDEKKPVILCGDLNVAHEEIDLANPKSNKKNAGFTKEEREGFSTLLSEGFVDTFRKLYPDKTGAYTFWTYMMNARAKNVGWRLDYFVISERFVDHLCDNVIRKDVLGSDHCPITLFLHV